MLQHIVVIFCNFPSLHSAYIFPSVTDLFPETIAALALLLIFRHYKI